VAECHTAFAELEAFSKQLQTEGRSKVLVSERKKVLSSLLQKFVIAEKPKPKPKPKPIENYRSKMDDLASTYRFDQLAQLLEKSEEEISGFSRDSLISMCHSAERFFSDLEGELSKKAVLFPAHLRDGIEISSLGFTDAQLLGKVQDGTTRNITWQDFTPEQLNELYRNILRDNLTEIDEVWQRHEAAIAFDWLVGDRKRASLAATRLCEENEAFRKSWEMMSQGLPQQ
jgi:hypothetical protein